MDAEPNLYNLGFALKNPNAPAVGPERIKRGDYLLTRQNGQRTLVDVTTTSSIKVGLLSHGNKAITEPGFAGASACKTKTRAYVKKWVIPQNVPLFIAAFELTGRWHTATVKLVDTYLSNMFPLKDRNTGQSNGFSTALSYATKCISVCARIATADAILALTTSGYRGALVPVAIPAE